ncbi:hypothetical protein [Streptomyces sp. 135]|uniref:hypothetical protein n=1 Tax=Streptomyces sp. 135 TaxID=2838850 RepID=UPI001CBF18B5|nr:hypothetical protein [Streptomyces sp. 135]
MAYGASTGKKTAAGFPGLENTSFRSGFQAASTVPTSGSDIYLFKDSEYVRYHVYED